MLKKIDSLIDGFTQKTVHKSADAVKKEIKETIDEITTGENAQRLLIGACIVSAVALVFSIFGRNNKPIVVNVYNH